MSSLQSRSLQRSVHHANALADLWQANASGAYDNSGYNLYGHQYTDADGYCTLTALGPGLYPGPRTLQMFTLEQINDAHDRLGNAATLAAYLRELNSIGVASFTSYLCDGHSEFFGSGGYSLESPAAHKQLTIADASNRERCIEHLHLHSQQKTSYVEMSKGLADSGIEKWTMDTTALTVTYYDKAGNEMLVEKIS